MIYSVNARLHYIKRINVQINIVLKGKLEIMITSFILIGFIVNNSIRFFIRFLL